MDVNAVLDTLMQAGVSLWLDETGTLRIDRDAPAELKQLVRDHKQALIDVRRAQAILNRPRTRSIRLRDGSLAVAYPPGANLDEIRWAMRILETEEMALVVNDEGLRPMTFREWKLRFPFGEERQKH